jgi:Glycosyl transferase family 2
MAPLAECSTLIALVMTVRDEVDLLRTNLGYHRFLGVDLMYVYDDGSSDGTPESIGDLDSAEVLSSVDPRKFSGRSELAMMAAAAPTLLTARQTLNTVDAMERARAAGAEWLISIDADELVATHLINEEPGQLAIALGKVPAQTESVIFPTLEMVQRRAAYDHVMAQETLFKRADARRLSRDVWDPFLGKVRRLPLVYGHLVGKSALRLRVDAVPYSVHRFRHVSGRRLSEAVVGHLLHYYCVDENAFIRKFRLMRDEPDVFLHGEQVPAQKRLWRDVVNRSGLSDDELREYFCRWVMFDERQLKELTHRRLGPLPRASAVVEAPAVQRVLEAMAEAQLQGG